VVRLCVLACLWVQGTAVAAESKGLEPSAKAYYLYSLAQQERFRRNYLDAIDHLKRAITHDPDSSALHLELSRLYWQLRDRERALAEGEQATRLDPENGEAHGFLATIYNVLVIRRGERGEMLEKAILHTERVIALEPAEDVAQEMLSIGRLYQLAGRHADAAEILENYLSREQPTPRARLWLAQAYAAQGDLEQGVAQLQQALEMSPESVQVLEALADLEQRRGNLKGAIDTVETLVERAPGNLPLYVRLGLLMRRAGHAEQALEVYDRGEEVARQRGDVDSMAVLQDIYLDWSEALLELGRMEDAGKRVDMGAKEFPDDPRFILARAQVEYRQGDLARGRQTLDDLLRANPRNPGLRGAVAEIYLGLAARLEGGAESHDEQVSLLRRAIEIVPENDRALNYLGYLWAERGEHLEESVELIRRALQVRENEPAYLDSLGWAYYQGGRYELAEPELVKAVERGGEEPVILDHLADLYAATARPELAVALWRRSLAAGARNNEELERKIQKALDGKDASR